jgi:omega-amidase
MYSDLRIALIQTDLYWKDSIANLAMFEEKIMGMVASVDLIVLPEMFTTGFTMEPEEVAEPMNFTTTRWMKQMAAQTQAVITGSIVIKDGGLFYNRLLWVEPNGKVQKYDKRHLFRMANEDQYYSMGKERAIFSCKGWKIFPQVCYDLRFPVWSRNQLRNGKLEYDLVFYVASWPSPRVSAWDILLQSRAVENLSYAIGVNRIGQDGNGVPYSGHSAAFDFKGDRLVYGGEVEGILQLVINYDELARFREKFPAWMDADNFEFGPDPHP